MHGHFGFDISEAMHAIRHILRKHRHECPDGPCAAPLPVEKDEPKRYLSAKQIIAIKKLLDEGLPLSTIALDQGVSQTIVCNIKNKRRRFTDLPDELHAIPAWLAGKQSRYHPHSLR